MVIYIWVCVPHTIYIHFHTYQGVESNHVSVFLNKVSSDKHDGKRLCSRAGYSGNDSKIKYHHSTE